MNCLPIDSYSQLFIQNFLEEFEGNLNGIPFLMFAKDKAGKYLFANGLKLRYFGFEKENDLIGLNDFDLCHTNDEAIRLRENDAQVIRLDQPCSFQEATTIITGERLTGISYKMPFRLKNKKVIGSMGISLLLTSGFHIKDGFKKYLPQLSKRQNECLNLLARGMTMKEIAGKVFLSPRTVEHYIENIKLKLNCHSRSELIAYYLSQ